jgi:hypothetical protein
VPTGSTGPCFRFGVVDRPEVEPGLTQMKCRSLRRLVERVRAKLGRVCTHPRAIDVDARDGEVTLRGPILSNEVDNVLGMSASVRGVNSVVNGLEPHDSPERVPSLQGEGRLAGPSLDVFQSNRAPATRALVSAGALAAAGLAMAAYARR